MTRPRRHRSASSRVNLDSTASPAAGEGGSLPVGVTRARLALRPRTPRGVVGFGVLLVVAGIVLNVAIWHHGSRRVEQEAWQHFEAAADVRQADLEHVLEVMRREASSLANDPGIARAVLAVRATQGDEARRRDLGELFARTREFGFGHTAVLNEEGLPLVLESGASVATALPHAALAREAMRAGELRWTEPHDGEIGILVPVGPGPGARRAVLVHADAALTLTPLLREWPGLGQASHAFLVEAAGDSVRALTSSSFGVRPRFESLTAGSRGVTRVLPHAGRHEWARPTGAVWYVTRPLPATGWVLVAEAERSALLVGLADVRRMLVALDAFLLAAFLGLALVWRRSYADGLARRESEVEERQAYRVQAILDNAFDAILTFDPTGRMRTANRAAAVLLGAPVGALEQRPVQALLAWDAAERPHAMPPTGAVVAGHALAADGTRVPVEFAIARSGEGAEARYTAIVRDVRERVEAERRVRAAHEELAGSHRRLEEANAHLEAASRLKSEFLANTSHELRTPLNGMIGFLQLVLDGACSSRDEEREFLRQSLQCSQQLLGLINDVLDLARLEAGRMTLVSECVDAASVLDEVRTATSATARQRGLRLVLEDRLPRGMAALGDAQRVRQVLVNLVGNSLKFTHAGLIVVRATVPEGSEEVRFEVRDTGIGIAPERQQAVFEAFVQADGSTTRRYGGSGLGLAISRNLVELMGGRIGLESAGEGQGTTAWFTLPRHDAVRADGAGRAA
ncbi:MAG: ATP-binding protein [bacterium]